MEILDQYNALREQVFEYFGYVEEWRVIPIDDVREYFWELEGVGPGYVRFATTVEKLINTEDGEYYEDEIYTQRHLPKWVYRGDDYTMVCVDTRIDGNKFLRIFSNDKEQTAP
jgi:hypothetical protein